MAETRILLVEDDPDVRNILGIILEGEGYIVDTAETVAEAMQRLDGEPYSLVATDWRLPDGLGSKVAITPLISELKPSSSAAICFRYRRKSVNATNC